MMQVEGAPFIDISRAFKVSLPRPLRLLREASLRPKDLLDGVDA